MMMMMGRLPDVLGLVIDGKGNVTARPPFFGFNTLVHRILELVKEPARIGGETRR